MSTPLIWIGIPVLFGVILSFLKRWRRLVLVLGILVSASLSLGAGLFSFDSVVVVGRWSVQISEQINILGLNLLITETARSTLILLFLMITFFMSASGVSNVQTDFVSYGLIITGLIVASLSVAPIYYGALFLIIALFFYVRILLPPGQDINPGVLRFLIFQSLGMLLLLLSGWFLHSGFELNDDLIILTQAIIILGIGLILAFSIFPFFTWVTMISESCHSYAAAFTASMVFGSNTLFFFSFLSKYQTLFSTVDIYDLIRISGIIMVATGGGLAAFQRNLGRLFGYGVVIEVGRSLLSIGLSSGDLHDALLLPRILSFGVWGLGLSVLRPHIENFDFKSIQGIGRHFQWACASVLTAHFSIAGLPLLAGFPGILALSKELVIVSIPSTIWCFLGNLGFISAGFRTLAVIVMGPKVLPWENKEDIFQKTFIFIGVLGLICLGIFPNWFHSWISPLSGGLWLINP